MVSFFLSLFVCLFCCLFFSFLTFRLFHLKSAGLDDAHNMSANCKMLPSAIYIQKNPHSKSLNFLSISCVLYAISAVYSTRHKYTQYIQYLAYIYVYCMKNKPLWFHQPCVHTDTHTHTVHFQRCRVSGLLYFYGRTFFWCSILNAMQEYIAYVKSLCAVCVLQYSVCVWPFRFIKTNFTFFFSRTLNNTHNVYGEGKKNEL